MSTIIREVGLIGNYNVEDSRANPGATAIYDFFPSGLRVTRIWVPAPTMYARDLSGGADFQVVGFRARLQERRSRNRWVTVQSSSERRAFATDKKPAEFPKELGELGGALAFDAPGPLVDGRLRPYEHGRYRIVHSLIWFQPGTETNREGYATVAITNHRQTVANSDGPNHFLGIRSYCRSPH